jgi:hypothetical protein
MKPRDRDQDQDADAQISSRKRAAADSLMLRWVATAIWHGDGDR